MRPFIETGRWATQGRLGDLHHPGPPFASRGGRRTVAASALGGGA